MKELSFVIPCFRSEKTIEKVIVEIKEKVVERPEYSFEIICVNDCSPDNVYDVLRHLAAADSRIKVVNLAKNSGKHAAVLAGYSFAEGDYIVNLDDDFQSPMQELWKLIEPLEKDECDASMAKYYEKKQSRWKNIGSAVNSQIAKIMLDRPKEFRFDNFWAIKKFVAEEMIKYSNPYPYLEGLLLRTTRRIKQINMEERSRGDDNSTGYTFKKSLALFVNGFTAFSVKPLRISMIIGFATAIIGFIWAIVLLIRKITGSITVAGYASTTVTLLILGGLLLMSNGLLGEYIGRMYISINQSPQYVIRNTINLEEQF